MKELIGVTDWIDVAFEPEQLKRASLFFNKIVNPSKLEWIQPFVKHKEGRVAELEWLYDKGIIIEHKKFFDDQLKRILKEPQLLQLYAEVNTLREDKVDSLNQKEIEEDREKFKGINELPYDAARKLFFGSNLGRKIVSRQAHLIYLSRSISQLEARLISAQLRELENLDAYPCLSSSWLPLKDPQAIKDDVCKIVLHALPVPDDAVSWEQILEYRSDPDSMGKFLALKHWMSEVARAEIPPDEIQEKLEWLIHDYNQHLTLHRIKTNAGTLETILMAGAGLLENLAKFNLEKGVKGLFSIKHRRIALMEAELTAPGREVAYIAKAREKFPQTT